MKGWPVISATRWCNEHQRGAGLGNGGRSGGGYSWPGGLTSTTRTEILHHGNACVTMMA